MEDGRELPLFKLETTSETHPFYTGTQKSVDSMGGRVEKFRNRFGKTTRRRLQVRQALVRVEGSPVYRAAFFLLAGHSHLHAPLESADASDRCPERRAPPAARRAADAAVRPTCCPASSAAGPGRTPTSSRSATCRRWPRRPQPAGRPALVGLPARRRRCCPTGSARCRSSCPALDQPRPRRASLRAAAGRTLR